MPKGTQPSAGASSRLGTRMRGDLAEAYGARGHGHSKLWYGYSAKAGRDFVFRSEIEYLHFLWVESDALVEMVDYAPQKRVARIAGETYGTIVDAELIRAGKTIWREVKPRNAEGVADLRSNLQLLIQMKAAAGMAACHELVTEEQICAQPHRIQNWQLVQRLLGEARYWELADYQNAVALLLRSKGSITLDEALALGDSRNSGLFAAGLFRGVQRGQFQGDIDQRPLTALTVFYLAGRVT